MADIDLSLSDIGALGFGSHTFLDSATPNQYVEGTSNHMTNNVYGINHRQMPLPIPINKDQYGLTFFTRPQLNMRRENLKNLRIMHPLLTTQSTSYQRLIRCTLDPRLMVGYNNGISVDEEMETTAIDCPLVDPEMAFIPILTNSLNTISGWPDIRSPTFTSKSGPYKEEHSMVDGVVVDYTAFDLTASFRNSRGDPITSMIYYWIHYQSAVFEGTMSPYPDFIIENEIDYNTRIYRLVMDPTKTKVQRIAACGAAFPTAAPTGGIFDFSKDKPYNDVNADIQIPFRAMGFICQDDILIRAFNQTVGIFQPGLRHGNPNGEMQKIPREFLSVFNNRGYPRIDPFTFELEWYVRKADYDARIGSFQQLDKLLDNALGFSLATDEAAERERAQR